MKQKYRYDGLLFNAETHGTMLLVTSEEVSKIPDAVYDLIGLDFDAREGNTDNTPLPVVNGIVTLN